MPGRSFPQTLFRVFENDPSARGFIVDLLCQPPFEARIGLAIQRDQMRREVAALGGREALGLLLQLGKTHAGNVAGGRVPSTGERDRAPSCNGSFHVKVFLLMKRLSSGRVMAWITR